MSDNWFVEHPEVMHYIMEHETHDRARCVECGRTVPLEAVRDCYRQGIEPECGHSWMMYQFDGQYVLE